jgi:hypothetical protein
LANKSGKIGGIGFPRDDEGNIAVANQRATELLEFIALHLALQSAILLEETGSSLTLEDIADEIHTG